MTFNRNARGIMIQLQIALSIKNNLFVLYYCRYDVCFFLATVFKHN